MNETEDNLIKMDEMMKAMQESLEEIGRAHV